MPLPNSINPAKLAQMKNIAFAYKIIFAGAGNSTLK